MPSTTHKKKVQRDATNTFALYVFFYHMWSGVSKFFVDIFKDD